MTPSIRHFPLVILQVLPLLALAGCGASGASSPSRPAVEFPTRAELAELPSKKAPVSAFGTTDARADEWTFEVQPPQDGAAYSDDSPWGTILADLVRGAPKLAPAPSMRCAAQEIARFHSKHRALPDEALRRFMIARCGATSPDATPFVWYVDAPPGYPEAQILAKARDGLAPLLAKVAPRGRGVVGLAADRNGQRVSVVGLVADEQARLEPGARVADANRHVVLRGTINGEFADVAALINQGESSVARCAGDPRVALPRFEITCALAPGDSYAWVEVLGRRPGHMLLTTLADVLAYEGDPGAIAYRARKYGPAAPVRVPDDLVRAIVAGVNGVRRGAKLAPLDLAPKQSAENARLAGTLFDASVTHDDATADRAAIGLLAGWDVGGTIRNGNFFLAAVAPTRDAESWLELALERPIGRLSLLDPDARSIAVGPTIPEGAPALGAAVTTYAFFDSPDHTADANRFFARLAAVRAARGLPAPVRVTGLDEVNGEIELVRRDAKSSMDALQDLLEAAVTRSGDAAHGYVLETNDVDRVPIPAELLAAGPMRAVIAVTHHRVQGAAWGQYVVFTIILGAGSPTREAVTAGNRGTM